VVAVAVAVVVVVVVVAVAVLCCVARAFVHACVRVRACVCARVGMRALWSGRHVCTKITGRYAKFTWRAWLQVLWSSCSSTHCRSGSCCPRSAGIYSSALRAISLGAAHSTPPIHSPFPPRQTRMHRNTHTRYFSHSLARPLTSASQRSTTMATNITSYSHTLGAQGLGLGATSVAVPPHRADQLPPCVCPVPSPHPLPGGSVHACMRTCASVYVCACADVFVSCMRVCVRACVGTFTHTCM